MPKSAQDQVQEQQAEQALQDQQETQQATQDAADEVSGPDKRPGDRGFHTVEEMPEILGQLQDPHQGSNTQPTMLWFTNSYGQPVLAAA